jgi:hypothetical protein
VPTTTKQSAGAGEAAGRRGQGSPCWLRLALGAFGLIWVGVILYVVS